jgi:hypothetical protein
MGVDFYAQVHVGWRIPVKEFEKKTRVVDPAITHEEPRFDPKSGKPVAPEVIVDKEEGFFWTFKGDHYDDLYDLSGAFSCIHPEYILDNLNHRYDDSDCVLIALDLRAGKIRDYSGRVHIEEDIPLPLNIFERLGQLVIVFQDELNINLPGLFGPPMLINDAYVSY